VNVWMAIRSRAGRRVAATLALCGAIPAILLAVAAARHLDLLSSDLEVRRLAGVTSRNAEMIRSRLGAAATLVEAVTVHDAGYDSSTLKQVTSSRAFKSVAVVDRNGPLAAGETPLSQPPRSSSHWKPGRRS